MCLIFLIVMLCLSVFGELQAIALDENKQNIAQLNTKRTQKLQCGKGLYPCGTDGDVPHQLDGFFDPTVNVTAGGQRKSTTLLKVVLPSIDTLLNESENLIRHIHDSPRPNVTATNHTMPRILCNSTTGSCNDNVIPFKSPTITPFKNLTTLITTANDTHNKLNDTVNALLKNKTVVPYDCMSINSCIKCVEKTSCGWCGAIYQCLIGNQKGPTFGLKAPCHSSWLHKHAAPGQSACIDERIQGIRNISSSIGEISLDTTDYRGLNEIYDSNCVGFDGTPGDCERIKIETMIKSLNVAQQSQNLDNEDIENQITLGLKNLRRSKEVDVERFKEKKQLVDVERFKENNSRTLERQKKQRDKSVTVTSNIDKIQSSTDEDQPLWKDGPNKDADIQRDIASVLSTEKKPPEAVKTHIYLSTTANGGSWNTNGIEKPDYEISQKQNVDELSTESGNTNFDVAILTTENYCEKAGWKRLSNYCHKFHKMLVETKRFEGWKADIGDYRNSTDGFAKSGVLSQRTGCIFQDFGVNGGVQFVQYNHNGVEMVCGDIDESACVCDRNGSGLRIKPSSDIGPAKTVHTQIISDGKKCSADGGFIRVGDIVWLRPLHTRKSDDGFVHCPKGSEGGQCRSGGTCPTWATLYERSARGFKNIQVPAPIGELPPVPKYARDSINPPLGYAAPEGFPPLSYPKRSWLYKYSIKPPTQSEPFPHLPPKLMKPLDLCYGVDCGSRGTCKKTTGKCKCIDGFSGKSCEWKLMLNLGHQSYSQTFTGKSETYKANAFNQMYQKSFNFIILRLCDNCAASHQKIYYKRLKDPKKYQPYKDFTKTWNLKRETLNKDFELYNDYNAAVEGIKAKRWRACWSSYWRDIGFPGFCGENSLLSGQFNSDSKKFSRWSKKVAFFALDTPKNNENQNTEEFQNQKLFKYQLLVANATSHMKMMNIDSGEYSRMEKPCGDSAFKLFASGRDIGERVHVGDTIWLAGRKSKMFMKCLGDWCSPKTYCPGNYTMSSLNMTSKEEDCIDSAFTLFSTLKNVGTPLKVLDKVWFQNKKSGMWFHCDETCGMDGRCPAGITSPTLLQEKEKVCSGYSFQIEATDRAFHDGGDEKLKTTQECETYSTEDLPIIRPLQGIDDPPSPKKGCIEYYHRSPRNEHGCGIIGSDSNIFNKFKPGKQEKGFKWPLLGLSGSKIVWRSRNTKIVGIKETTTKIENPTSMSFVDKIEYCTQLCRINNDVKKKRCDYWYISHALSDKCVTGIGFKKIEYSRNGAGNFRMNGDIAYCQRACLLYEKLCPWGIEFDTRTKTCIFVKRVDCLIGKDATSIDDAFPPSGSWAVRRKTCFPEPPPAPPKMPIDIQRVADITRKKLLTAGMSRNSTAYVASVAAIQNSVRYAIDLGSFDALARQMSENFITMITAKTNYQLGNKTATEKAIENNGTVPEFVPPPLLNISDTRIWAARSAGSNLANTVRQVAVIESQIAGISPDTFLPKLAMEAAKLLSFEQLFRHPLKPKSFPAIDENGNKLWKFHLLIMSTKVMFKNLLKGCSDKAARKLSYQAFSSGYTDYRMKMALNNLWGFATSTSQIDLMSVYRQVERRAAEFRVPNEIRQSISMNITLRAVMKRRAEKLVKSSPTRLGVSSASNRLYEAANKFVNIGMAMIHQGNWSSEIGLEITLRAVFGSLGSYAMKMVSQPNDAAIALSNSIQRVVSIHNTTSTTSADQQEQMHRYIHGILRQTSYEAAKSLAEAMVKQNSSIIKISDTLRLLLSSVGLDYSEINLGASKAASIPISRAMNDGYETPIVDAFNEASGFHMKSSWMASYALDRVRSKGHLNTVNSCNKVAETTSNILSSQLSKLPNVNKLSDFDKFDRRMGGILDRIVEEVVSVVGPTGGLRKKGCQSTVELHGAKGAVLGLNETLWGKVNSIGLPDQERKETITTFLRLLNAGGLSLSSSDHTTISQESKPTNGQNSVALNAVRQAEQKKHKAVDMLKYLHGQKVKMREGRILEDGWNAAWKLTAKSFAEQMVKKYHVKKPFKINPNPLWKDATSTVGPSPKEAEKLTYEEFTATNKNIIRASYGMVAVAKSIYDLTRSDVIHVDFGIPKSEVKAYLGETSALAIALAMKNKGCEKYAIKKAIKTILDGIYSNSKLVGPITVKVLNVIMGKTVGVRMLLNDCRRAFDHNISTWWDPYGHPEGSWIQTNFEQVSEVSRLRISLRNPLPKDGSMNLRLKFSKPTDKEQRIVVDGHSDGDFLCLSHKVVTLGVRMYIEQLKNYDTFQGITDIYFYGNGESILSPSIESYCDGDKTQSNCGSTFVSELLQSSKNSQINSIAKEKCRNILGCTVKKNKCEQLACSSILEPYDCSLMPGCNWHSTKNKTASVSSTRIPRDIPGEKEVHYNQTLPGQCDTRGNRLRVGDTIWLRIIPKSSSHSSFLQCTPELPSVSSNGKVEDNPTAAPCNGGGKCADRAFYFPGLPPWDNPKPVLRKPPPQVIDWVFQEEIEKKRIERACRGKEILDYLINPETNKLYEKGELVCFEKDPILKDTFRFQLAANNTTSGECKAAFQECAKVSNPLPTNCLEEDHCTLIDGPIGGENKCVPIKQKCKKVKNPSKSNCLFKDHCAFFDDMTRSKDVILINRMDTLKKLEGAPPPKPPVHMQPLPSNTTDRSTAFLDREGKCGNEAFKIYASSKSEGELLSVGDTVWLYNQSGNGTFWLSCDATACNSMSRCPAEDILAAEEEFEGSNLLTKETVCTGSAFKIYAKANKDDISDALSTISAGDTVWFQNTFYKKWINCLDDSICAASGDCDGNPTNAKANDRSCVAQGFEIHSSKRNTKDGGLGLSLVASCTSTMSSTKNHKCSTAFDGSINTWWEPQLHKNNTYIEATFWTPIELSRFRLYRNPKWAGFSDEPIKDYTKRACIDLKKRQLGHCGNYDYSTSNLSLKDCQRACITDTKGKCNWGIKWNKKACYFVGDSACGHKFVNKTYNPKEERRAYSSVNINNQQSSQSMLDSPGGWIPLSNEQSPWMSIDLGKIQNTIAIITQGILIDGVKAWVKSYRASSSNDNTKWEQILPPNRSEMWRDLMTRFHNNHVTTSKGKVTPFRFMSLNDKSKAQILHTRRSRRSRSRWGIPSPLGPSWSLSSSLEDLKNTAIDTSLTDKEKYYILNGGEILSPNNTITDLGTTYEMDPNIVYQANNDYYTKKNNPIAATRARYIRIEPISYEHYIGMRIGVIIEEEVVSDMNKLFPRVNSEVEPHWRIMQKTCFQEAVLHENKHNISISLEFSDPLANITMDFPILDDPGKFYCIPKVNSTFVKISFNFPFITDEDTFPGISELQFYGRPIPKLLNVGDSIWLRNLATARNTTFDGSVLQNYPILNNDTSWLSCVGDKRGPNGDKTTLCNAWGQCPTSFLHSRAARNIYTPPSGLASQEVFAVASTAQENIDYAKKTKGIGGYSGIPKYAPKEAFATFESDACPAENLKVYVSGKDIGEVVRVGDFVYLLSKMTNQWLNCDGTICQINGQCPGDHPSGKDLNKLADKCKGERFQLYAQGRNKGDAIQEDDIIFIQKSETNGFMTCRSRTFSDFVKLIEEYGITELSATDIAVKNRQAREVAERERLALIVKQRAKEAEEERKRANIRRKAAEAAARKKAALAKIIAARAAAAARRRRKRRRSRWWSWRFDEVDHNLQKTTLERFAEKDIFKFTPNIISTPITSQSINSTETTPFCSIDETNCSGADPTEKQIDITMKTSACQEMSFGIHFTSSRAAVSRKLKDGLYTIEWTAHTPMIEDFLKQKSAIARGGLFSTNGMTSNERNLYRNEQPPMCVVYNDSTDNQKSPILKKCSHYKKSETTDMNLWQVKWLKDNLYILEARTTNTDGQPGDFLCLSSPTEENQIIPERKHWGNGITFCGFEATTEKGARSALLENKQAVWVLERIDSGQWFRIKSLYWADDCVGFYLPSACVQKDDHIVVCKDASKASHCSNPAITLKDKCLGGVCYIMTKEDGHLKRKKSDLSMDECHSSCSITFDTILNKKISTEAECTTANRKYSSAIWTIRKWELNIWIDALATPQVCDSFGPGCVYKNKQCINVCDEVSSQNILNKNSCETAANGKACTYKHVGSSFLGNSPLHRIPNCKGGPYDAPGGGIFRFTPVELFNDITHPWGSGPDTPEHRRVPLGPFDRQKTIQRYREQQEECDGWPCRQEYQRRIASLMAANNGDMGHGA